MSWDMPDGHEVWEHECPGCGATVYTKRRRCQGCEDDYQGARADYEAGERKDRGRC